MFDLWPESYFSIFLGCFSGPEMSSAHLEHDIPSYCMPLVFFLHFQNVQIPGNYAEYGKKKKNGSTQMYHVAKKIAKLHFFWNCLDEPQPFYQHTSSSLIPETFVFHWSQHEPLGTLKTQSSASSWFIAKMCMFSSRALTLFQEVEWPPGQKVNAKMLILAAEPQC